MAGQNQEFYVAMLGLKCLLEIYVGYWIQKWSLIKSFDRDKFEMSGHPSGEV